MRVHQVDASTGEILEGATLVVSYPKRRNGFGEGWVAMSQEAMQKLATANLGEQSHRVLLMLLARLDFENWINVSQAELARQLGMKRQNVNSAMRRLVAEGVVLEGPKVGGHGTFRLDPGYGWKGAAKTHHEALRERMKASRMQVLKG